MFNAGRGKKNLQFKEQSRTDFIGKNILKYQKKQKRVEKQK
tara:strand:+ start:3272 stop:3394 length:123 start_codon:yes stop_codon:yes gene_type:complete